MLKNLVFLITLLSIQLLWKNYAEFWMRLKLQQVGGQAVLGRQLMRSTPWLTERHGYDPTCDAQKSGVFDYIIEYPVTMEKLRRVLDEIKTSTRERREEALVSDTESAIFDS
ncbi:unnamed protein product [[Candida] boidinii]|nr:unnamed protein product [[Candida] boidinii]